LFTTELPAHFLFLGSWAIAALCSKDELERAWIKFQLNVAAIRPTIGPLCNIAFEARRGHTFYPGAAPQDLGVRAVMMATPGERNGIPDAFNAATNGSYAARTISVVAASVILIWLDSAIQNLARDLNQPSAAEMLAGDDIAGEPGQAPVKASTLLWAAGNNVRHVDEWFATASSYKNPQSPDDNRLRQRQDRSMKPLAAVLGCSLPITENVAFEVFQVLTAESETQGSFDRLELHILRVGQDLVQRSGLTGAPIGVTVTETRHRDDLGEEDRRNIVISDGIARAASSLPDTGRLESVRPLLDPPNDEPD
jgi:hypothetical protein